MDIRYDITLEAYGDGFPVLLGVYKGTALNNLTAVAADDGSNAGGYSTGVFGAQPATTYFIAIDGKNGATGAFELYCARQGNHRGKGKA